MESIIIRLKEGMKTELDALSKELNLSSSAIVRLSIRQFLKDYREGKLTITQEKEDEENPTPKGEKA